MKIAIIVILALLIVISIIFTFIAAVAVHPKVRAVDEMIESEISKGNIEKSDVNFADEYIIESFDGYKLHTYYMPASQESDRYVVITHGHTGSHIGSIKYARFFNKLGVNCVLYDDRDHGKNTSHKVTFGLVERYDLMEVIRDTYERYGQDIHLGLHGESMGSMITCLALDLNPRVDYAVIDCGAADLMNVLRDGVKFFFNMPKFFADIACFYSILIFHVNLKKVRPIDAVAKTRVPLCFVHGGADRLINPENSRRMNEAAAGYSEYHEYPGADHAASLDSDRERYLGMLSDFLDKVYK